MVKPEFETIGIPGLGHAGVCTRLADALAAERLATAYPLFSSNRWVLRPGPAARCPADPRNRHLYFESTNLLTDR